MLNRCYWLAKPLEIKCILFIEFIIFTQYLLQLIELFIVRGLID